MTRRIRRAHLLVVGAVAALALATGCAEDDDPPAVAGTAPATTQASPSTAPTAPAPVALDRRVVAGDDLPGFAAAPAEILDLDAIAAENEVPVAELRRRGTVRTAIARLGGPPEAFGVSAASEHDTPAQAAAEAARLFQANGSSEPGLEATPLAVDGIPGARASRKTGSRGGQDYVAVEVTWSDGTVAHELFVLARAADLNEDDVLGTAAALHARTAGAPLPATP